MELGRSVTGSLGHLGHLSRPGHRVIILTRCETRVFSGYRKNAQNAKRTFKMLKWQKSLSGVWCCLGRCKSCFLAPDINTLTYLPCRVLEYSIRYSTEYSSSKRLDSHTAHPTHKSTFGVHYRTGSTPSVLWRCWLGDMKGIRSVKTEWWGAGVVICLERGADLHMAQLMPLPLTVSCFSKIQIGFTFLLPAHPGSPGQRAVKPM